MRTIVILRLKVAQGREAEFEDFLQERAERIRATPGSQKVYLLKPLGSDKEYRMVSWWDDLQDHDAWVRKESYELHHSAEHPGIIVGTIPYEVASVLCEW
jgi:heme-degrading monooxygenase HmoA